MQTLTANRAMPAYPYSDLPPVTRCPDMMAGTPCFTGTRLPVQVLFDYLREGHSIERFLSGYSFVTKAQVIDALDYAEEMAKCFAPKIDYQNITAAKKSRAAEAGSTSTVQPIGMENA